MQDIRRSSLTRFFVVPLTLIAVFSGCYKWSTPSQSPVDFIREEEPSKVRLTLTDGRKPVVLVPTAAEDAISGTVGDSVATYPLDDIERLERRTFSVLKTLAIPASLFAAFVLLVGLTWEEFSPSSS